LAYSPPISGRSGAAEDLVESITRGNPTAVKVVLATVVVALAAYQVILAAVVYGRAKPRFLESGVAGVAHRASGRVIAAITAVVAFMCIAVFGYDLE
jgi:hypothetical protein